MRKSEFGTLLLVAPSLLGYLMGWYGNATAQGHMPSFDGLAALVLQLGGILLLRFVLPIYAISMLFFGVRRRLLDFRSSLHLTCAFVLSVVAWIMLEIPK